MTSRPELLQKEGLPTTFVLELNVDPKTIGEYWVGLKGKEGHIYPDKVNKWFSTAIGRDVVLLHSAMDRLLSLLPNRHIHMAQGDVRKTFTTDASFHIVNLSSCKDLQKRVHERHPGEEKNYRVDHEQFRPNMVVETGEAYSEDLISEMRLGTCMMRTAGPAIRCNTIRVNYDNQTKFEE